MKLRKFMSEHKIKHRYRLSFQSENTLNELWSFKLSRTKVIIISAVIVLALASLISYVIVSTPLKTLLPGYLKSELRNEYVLYNMKLDSLENVITAKSIYFNNLHNVLTDNIQAPKNTIVQDSASSVIPLDSLMLPSEREKDFLQKYDENEKFNLSVLTPLAAEQIVFAAPIQGKVVTAKDVKTFENGIKIEAAKGTPIASIYDGTVISLTESASGTTIIIQHPNGFASKYTGINDLLIVQGSKVSAAQRIGVISGNSTNIALWHNGSAVNLQDYISF